MVSRPKEKTDLSDHEIAARMDHAIRKSLQMPPKPHKESRKPRSRKKGSAAAKSETEHE